MPSVEASLRVLRGQAPLTEDASTRTSGPRRQRETKLGGPQRRYESSLRSLGENVGTIITGVSRGDNWLQALPSLRQLLSAYADALKPWARATASRMLNEIDASNRESWRSLGQAISAQLRTDILRTPLGDRMRELLDEQVQHIRSIPMDAADRVHELALKGLEDSSRGEEIYAEVMRSGEVAESHGVLIARSETARTATVLMQARHEFVGGTHYHWETSKDGSVRPGHAAMQGKVCEWASPPAVNENGRIMHHHPGEIWNCRCWARPILDLH